jgi:hypothetical protein
MGSGGNMAKTPIFDFNAHDITRIWNLAIAIYDGDDENADMRDYFAQAMQIYVEFMDDLNAGGTEFETGDTVYVSEREVGPDGDRVRFRPKT